MGQRYRYTGICLGGPWDGQEISADHYVMRAPVDVGPPRLSSEPNFEVCEYYLREFRVGDTGEDSFYFWIPTNMRIKDAFYLLVEKYREKAT